MRQRTWPDIRNAAEGAGQGKVACHATADGLRPQRGDAVPAQRTGGDGAVTGNAVSGTVTAAVPGGCLLLGGALRDLHRCQITVLCT